MQINNPIYTIPTKNKRVEQKPGGGGPPKYLGDDKDFEGHKRQRVSEINNILQLAEKIKPQLNNPHDLTFFEIELHEGAIAKSAQPTELLSYGNIDIYAQKNENTFFASSNIKSFTSFRDTISKFDLKENRNEGAYLSAITSIRPIPKKDILIDNFEGKNGSSAYLFLQNILSEQDCEIIFEQLKKDFSVNADFFVSASGAKVIYGKFNATFLNTISEPHPKNPIQRIEKSIDFVIPQGLSYQHKFDEVKVIPPASSAVVGIVDSGIEKHELYKDLIIDVFSTVSDPQLLDLSHGTFVGSRTIFGNDIEDQIVQNKALFAQTRVLDIRVMKKDQPNGEVTINDYELIEVLKKVLDKYGNDVKVYNLSLNDPIDNGPTHTKKRRFISLELDALAFKHKVLFVVSAGNHYVFTKQPYPECLLDNEAVITPPADILNGIVVGSIADSDSSRSIANNNEPSPFSRSGLPGSKKPDVAHFGGNIDKYYRADGIGVKGFSTTKDYIVEDVGTSHATPLVSQITAQVYSYLEDSGTWKSPPIDLTRALVLHSARYSLPTQSKINAVDIKRMVGFGIPDFGRALDCAESTATFAYCDTIGKTIKQNNETLRANKHKIKFIVPEELVGKKKKVRVRGTLVYTPQTSSISTIDHSLVDIEINLHYFNSAGTLVSGNLVEDNEDNREKWNPVKSFERTYSAYSGGEWELWLSLNARGLADDKSYTQDYALVISIEDVTPDITERVNVYQIIKEQYKDYIQIQSPQIVVST